MLMAPLDDRNKSVLLFPAWPVDQWNVRFKLHAPLNTTVEASCQGGTLEYLRVTPRKRAADVKVLQCRPRAVH
jgi:alpha-L-fucosidase 2|eukprot:COSAG02_NODE_1480_length_12399_cov_250.195935_5_plen_73_part_00